MAEAAGYNGAFGYKSGSVSTTLGDYTEFEAITSATLNYNNENLDISNLKEDVGAHVFIQGLANGTLELEGFYFSGDTPQDAIRSNALAKTAVSLALAPDGTSGYAGSFFVTSFTLGDPVDGVATFSASLQLTGALSALA